MVPRMTAQKRTTKRNAEESSRTREEPVRMDKVEIYKQARRYRPFADDIALLSSRYNDIQEKNTKECRGTGRKDRIND